MMKSAVVLLFILIFVKRSCHLTLNSRCVTPNGEEAFCITIFSCTVIANALASNDFTAILFAQKSQCGYENVPLVCCGTLGRLISPQLEERTVPLHDFTIYPLPNRSVCGFQRETDRVLGGKITDIYEFPWMVGLEYKSKIRHNSAGVRCGGSLINTKYVLTAAHCMDTVEFELIAAWLGDWKLSSDPDCSNLSLEQVCNNPVLKIPIAKKISHSFYANKINDIALLRLDREISYTDFIRPICLPPGNLPYPKVGTRLTVTGWGFTTQEGDPSDFKQKLEVPIISNDDCGNVSKRHIIRESHLCAGGEVGKDSCFGDSGGPLMRNYVEAESNQLQWYLEGLVSWGNGCAAAGTPGVYTRVSSYLHWIIYSISKSDKESTPEPDYNSLQDTLLPQRSICGLEKNGKESTFEDGKITKMNEFPWVVALVYSIPNRSNEILCAGSLITNRYVLTAATCLNTFKYELTGAWLGDWKISSNPDCVIQNYKWICNDPVLKLKISNSIVYPYHTAFGISDIALLRLEQKVTFTDYIRPICLPTFNFNLPNGSHLTVSGWETPGFGNISNYKLKFKKPLISISQCKDLYKNRFNERIEEHSTLCTEGRDGKDLCRGGAPLMKEYDDGLSEQRQWFQVGIHSWVSRKCGEPGNPSVYTKISQYVKWILRTLHDER